MAKEQDCLDFGCDMVDFASGVDDMASPDEVLDGLHAVSHAHLKINVLGACMMPIRFGDVGCIELGKTGFLHKSVPRGWWQEWLDMSSHHPAPGLAMAQMSLAPFVRSELMHTLEPIGIDRWSIELAARYGMRDGLNCPVGGRWLVAYWSDFDLTRQLTDQRRVILTMGANFAAIRLQKLTSGHKRRFGQRPAITARELAVLRSLSLGRQTSEIAQELELGEETVRTHLKKAQMKLGARNRTHAVAQALRSRMMP